MYGARADHDDLRERMTRFAVLLSAPDGSANASLLRQRAAFARCFALHVADEQRALARLVATDRSMRDPLRGYYDRLGALRTDYSAHISTWTPAAIGGDWHGYGQAVFGLQDRLRDLMAWEERNLTVPAVA
ncbi:hypothetical protein SAMN05192583_3003 [Sphingomonas gellani]|uniref:Hemerythrin HHE cation binding domain-containing protein n=1 Tax=Sphingomonas gellani TaxID=1166340 RepID=A0A1H8HCE8_9SPHN|nr:hypothetical protein [Sphingomonas gellani]SEN53785.1 hypothetical protein SAMN05192583_3003 [Sphingomonas gellani]